MTAGTGDAAVTVEVKPKGHAETVPMDEPAAMIDTASGDLSAPPPLHQHAEPTKGERPIHATLFLLCFLIVCIAHECGPACSAVRSFVLVSCMHGSQGIVVNCGGNCLAVEQIASPVTGICPPSENLNCM